MSSVLEAAYPLSTMRTSKERSDMHWAFVRLVVSISLFCSVGMMQILKGNAELVLEEENALETLRESFNLSTWAGDPCDTVDWISCSNNFVVTLTLEQRNLTGTIPADIAKLRHISELTLSGNSLTGMLPDLSNMTNLTLLALDGNNLTGGIPASIFNHSALQKLNLSNNPLGGSIPDMSELTEVTELDLTQTEVNGSIPESIQSMSKLQNLLLGFNPQLKGLVPDIKYALNIRFFNGSHCALSGPLPDLRNTGGLTMVDLEMNDFSGSIPPPLLQHQSLETLSLSNNPRLSGEIPDLSLLLAIVSFNASYCNLSGPVPSMTQSTNLQIIELSNNRLTKFPSDLESLTGLRSIDVHNNNLAGPLPDLPPGSTQTTSTNLRWLIFSNNNFSGEIPSSWNTLTYLEGMLLGSNNLSGVIKKEIGSLTNLRQLNLSSNYFSGPIPEEIGDLSKLEMLDLRNNLLNGTVPGSLASLTNLHTLLLDNNRLTEIPASLLDMRDINISYLNNPGLQILYGKKNSHKSQTGTIVGVVIGATVSIGIAVLFIMLYKRKKKKYGDQISKEDMPKSTQSFSLKKIKIITENFKTMVGKGGFGPVYYGKLSDGKEVAVKVRAADSKQGVVEFLNEVRLLSKLHHRNVVALVGYCLEEQQQILVYDFMPQGTLHDHLYQKGLRFGGPHTTSSDTSEHQSLSWKMRLNIAVNAAKGLEYLHKDCNPPIIHRDVKSRNILLTSKLQAKVGDLGISKQAPEIDSRGFNQSGVSTVIKGTIGYLDPEYFIRHRLTIKSDVFSFGMVLLEIITAKKPQTVKFPNSDATNIGDWVRDAVRSDRIETIVDPSLQDEYNREVMVKVTQVALSCVTTSGSERPEMGDISLTLTQALEMEGESKDTEGGNIDNASRSKHEIVPLSLEQEVTLTCATASSSSFGAYSHPSWITDPR